MYLLLYRMIFVQLDLTYTSNLNFVLCNIVHRFSACCE